MEIIEYSGQTYYRYTNKWVDKNNMVVHQSLQFELNSLFAASLDLSGMNPWKLIEEGDKYKEDESYILAIRFYEEAIETCDAKTLKYILPRISSCYRKAKSPQKAINLFAETKSKYGVEMLTPVLLTTAAAAYCDMLEYEKAKICAEKAKKALRGEFSIELNLVETRIKKGIDGNKA